MQANKTNAPKRPTTRKRTTTRPAPKTDADARRDFTDAIDALSKAAFAYLNAAPTPTERENRRAAFVDLDRALHTHILAFWRNLDRLNALDGIPTANA